MTLTDQQVHYVHTYCVAHVLGDSLMAQKLDNPTFNFPRNLAFVEYSHSSPLKGGRLFSLWIYPVTIN